MGGPQEICQWSSQQGVCAMCLTVMLSKHSLSLQVNVTNIGNILLELFQENIVRGRGLVARSVMQAQADSPMFTHVYAALVAIINVKFPQIGELIAKRLIVRFQRAFRRNDKVSGCVIVIWVLYFLE